MEPESEPDYEACLYVNSELEPTFELVNLQIGANILDFLTVKDLCALEITCKLVYESDTRAIEKARRSKILSQFLRFCQEDSSTFTTDEKNAIWKFVTDYCHGCIRDHETTEQNNLLNCTRNFQSVYLHQQQKVRSNVRDVRQLICELVSLLKADEPKLKFFSVLLEITSKSLKETFLLTCLMKMETEERVLHNYALETIIAQQEDMNSLKYLLQNAFANEQDKVSYLLQLMSLLCDTTGAIKSVKEMNVLLQRISRFYTWCVDEIIIKQIAEHDSSSYNTYVDTCLNFLYNLYCSPGRNDFIGVIVLQVCSQFADFQDIWTSFADDYNRGKTDCSIDVSRWRPALAKQFLPWLEQAEIEANKITYYANYLLFNCESKGSDIPSDCILFCTYLLRRYGNGRSCTLSDLDEQQTVDIVKKFEIYSTLHKTALSKMRIWTTKALAQYSWMFGYINRTPSGTTNYDTS